MAEIETPEQLIARLTLEGEENESAYLDWDEKTIAAWLLGHVRDRDAAIEARAFDLAAKTCDELAHPDSTLIRLTRDGCSICASRIRALAASRASPDATVREALIRDDEPTLSAERDTRTEER